MWKYIIYVLAHFFIMVLSQSGSNFQGEGVWSTLNIGRCETEIENPIITFDVQRRRINQTNAIFRARIGVTMEIDDTFQLRAQVCLRNSNRGCRRVYVIEDSFESFVNKYAQRNLESAFRRAGLDQRGFPIPEGNYVVDNFTIDSCQLPRLSPYGRYEVDAFIIKDERRVGCLRVVLQFSRQENTCRS